MLSFTYNFCIYVLYNLKKSFILVCNRIFVFFPFGGLMNIAQMLEQSGILTLLGMCVVFAFLIIMIGAMNLLHAVIHLFGLDKVEPPAAAASAAPAAQQADNGAVIAAIAAAVHEKEA